jgi:Putative Flp pilus-assembly TadE/G-like
VNELFEQVRGHVRDQRGGVMAMFAVVLPVLLLFFAFVVDVGNWFQHKRHLQMQADAAVLAGAGQFNECFGTSGTGSTTITDEATKYGGGPGSIYNGQVGGSNKGEIFVRFNSKTYEVGGPPADDTVEAPPCTAMMLDVKETEKNLPLFFSGLVPGLPSLPAINARARIALFEEDTKRNTLPIAIPDPGLVTAAAVDFINEDTGSVLGSSNLTQLGTAWNNSSTPVPVNMSGASHVGAVVKLTGQTPPPSTLSCSDALVQCYDFDSLNATTAYPSRGILFVRGYPSAGYTTTGSTGEPRVKSVTLFVGGGSPCSSAYFFSILSGSCNIGVEADVTFPAGSGTTTVSTTITGGNGYADTNRLSNTSGTTWRTTGSGQFKFFTVPAQEGPLNVKLSWSKTGGTYNGQTCGNGSSACTGDWNGYLFQRSLAAADPNSGPITAAVLNEGGSISSHSYANDGGATTHNLWINIQLQPSPANAIGVNSPPVYLRVVGGSQNQTIDCDPNWPNLQTELAQGCRPEYKVNTSPFLCPSYSTLWNTPEPWSCVKTQTGSATGQVTQGMEDRMTRLAGVICPPNNWSSFPNLSPTDPRLTPVIVTAFGSFGGSGNAVVPVTRFSELYVTGWSKQGGSKTQPDCAGDDAPPGKGYIVGHFVKYIDSLNSGGGTRPCSQSAFGNCVAVWTK